MRFACIYFSNGVEPIHWFAKGAGAAMEIGPGLAPMQPYREDMVFLKGLFNEQAASHKSVHLGRIPNLLSGAWVSTDQNEIRAGKTMDQVLAERIGKNTALPSLVLGIEPTELRLEDGLSMIYGSCISWTSASKPATKEIYPARAFDASWADGDRELDRSVLDQLTEDAAGSSGKSALPTAASSTNISNRSAASSGASTPRPRTSGSKAGGRRLTEPNMPRPKDDLPQNVPEHMRLMLDLIVLAFQMDKTRIATCMLNNDLSQMNFGFLDGVQGAPASRPDAQRPRAGTRGDVSEDEPVSTSSSSHISSGD